MNKLDIDYNNILNDIIENGNLKADRTGTGTISVFGRTIRHKMINGFPLLTTKKVAYKQIISELIWFLMGDTNIQWLLKNKNKIWVGDAHKFYSNNALNPQLTKDEFILKIINDDDFAKKWGEMGPIYGHQWRNFNGVDQISEAIKTLKNNPDNRRIMVNSWHVDQIPKMKLPPCHYNFQLYSRDLKPEEYYLYKDKYESIPNKALSLKWNQRSCDFPLGIPFNIASYGLLLEIISKIVGMIPDEIIGDFGDSHIYLNQIELCKEQIKRKPYELPILKHKKSDDFYQSITKDINNINDINVDDFEIVDYISHDTIKYPLSN